MLVITVIILFMMGCSHSSFLSVNSHESTKISSVKSSNAMPITFELHDVPHNPRKQQGTDCAPDSLRMVLKYWGREVGEQDIPRLLESRGRGGGTSFSQMQEITVKHYNLPAFIIPNCDLTSIKALILNGWPPIIGYRVSMRYYHAVVAVGYDDKRRQMLVNDPNFIGVRRIRYSDLGGFSEDGVQRLSCLIVLPLGKTEEDIRKGLLRYMPIEAVSKLVIAPSIPQ